MYAFAGRFVERAAALSRLALVFFAVLTAATIAQADTLDSIRQRGTLRWGGDKEGGGPYIFPDPQRPDQILGFEVELMTAISAQLGVQSQFEQQNWAQLPEHLNAGRVDVIVNGFELTKSKLRGFLSTVPYYIYELQLIASASDNSLRSWDDLKQGGKKRKVGVLGGSAAEEYTKREGGDAVEVVSYDSTTQAFEDIKNGQIDATVTDTPAAVFYLPRYRSLHAVGEAVGRGYYVILLRSGEQNTALRDALNRALLELIRTGKLREIYRKFGLWNKTQLVFATEQAGDPESFSLRLLREPQEPTEYSVGASGADEDVQAKQEPRGWYAVFLSGPGLLKAAGRTVLLSVLSMPLAILIGLFVALGRLYTHPILQRLFTVYVEIVRGTPLLLQLYVIFFLLPAAGVKFDAVTAAVIGLAINYSAYEAEIYRAGLLAIPSGQMEAALSLGMTKVQALRHVVVPQAIRLVLPPVTNDFIALFKDTAVCSAITVVELTKQYNISANSTGAYLQMALATGLLYLIMSYPLALLTKRLERRTRPVHV